MLDLKGPQKLLVIAPHPDDEVIGCAGLIQKVKQNKGKVYVLFLTVGDTNDFSKTGSSSLTARKKEIENVSEFLEYDDYDIAFEGDDYHLKLDKLGQKKLMDVIERESKVSIEKIKPTIVVFPSASSYNQDHRIAALATHAALRPSNKESKHFVPTILKYEEAADLWSTEEKRSPDVLVSLSEAEINTKLKALRLYKSQDRPAPNTRSAKVLESLSILRGSQAGTQYAEGFISHRLILN